MNETKFADSGEEESLGRFAQYIDYPKEMPFPNMRFECGGPGLGHPLSREVLPVLKSRPACIQEFDNPDYW